MPLSGIDDQEIVLDVSNGDQYAKSHIKGAIHIPEKSFLSDDGALKSPEEMAAVLGAAGITRDDPVLVYSDSLSSGEAAFVFWALIYLGQEKVKLLDGGLGSYTAASLPLEIAARTLPPAEYSPSLNADILASYDYVNGGIRSDSRCQDIPGVREWEDTGSIHNRVLQGFERRQAPGRVRSQR